MSRSHDPRGAYGPAATDRRPYRRPELRRSYPDLGPHVKAYTGQVAENRQVSAPQQALLEFDADAEAESDPAEWPEWTDAERFVPAQGGEP